MKFMDNRIKCRVEECIYNGEGLCGAESIEVKSSGESMRVGTSDEHVVRLLNTRT